MRLVLAALVSLGLLACDVESLPPPDSDEPEPCVVEWSNRPCADALRTAETIGCDDDLTSWVGHGYEIDCVLAVTLLRGLSDDRNLVTNAWRDGVGSEAYAACEAFEDASLDYACPWHPDLTTRSDCLMSPELGGSGLSGPGLEYACGIITGDCAWNESVDSLTGESRLRYECE